MIEQLIFYFFSGVFIVAGSMVVIVRSAVHAALFLVLAFCTSAGLWLLLEAEFLAITLVLVYVGAVMVLFLFVVMMLDVKTAPLHERFIRYFPVGVLVALLIAVQLFIVVGARHFGLELFAAPARQGASYSNTEALGLVLYTDYVYPFEIAAVILLVAMIAAIALTMRKRRGVKYQQPGNQVAVRSEDRVRLIKM
uniref:NADH-quinone oxidoreductase subunit J n=1 Tax=Candidatus Kentrum sp. SD TaxID=2126332 RepID=A0A450YGI0_9GAMM|nr:MAG: NADH dehydrogenase subunit J [Candidatus Kentron sp. SD]VFK40660.1 MAG: NADH dehydrogenase subunit J [Candidatus Kentron sp. SD]